jgi:hypothetical protein
VFRHRRPLRPWRAVLRNGLDRFADVLDVAAEPDATAAIEVLLEIADRVGHERPTRSLVTASPTRGVSSPGRLVSDGALTGRRAPEASGCSIERSQGSTTRHWSLTV